MVGSERGIRRRAEGSAASMLLAGAIVVSSLVVPVVHTGGLALVVHNQSLLRYGGVTAATLAAGDWWRLLSSQFLHVHLPHAILNAAAVFVIGAQVERAVGTWRLVALWMCGGTAGQLAAVAAMPAIVATGASQAALALAAAALILGLRRNERRTALWAPLAYTGIQIALDVLFAGTIKLPHAVSFSAGALVAAYWRWRARTTARRV